MGETMAESLRDQIEIEKPISFENSFKESVSFGRFENDLLSWERWSSFSQNKYLEEVGKCSTPGSVAKKKAYFEAHYRKIAARKAEMDQEEEMGDGMFVSDTPSNGNSISSGCATKLEFVSRDGDDTTTSMEPDNNSIASTSEEQNQDAVGVNSQGSSGSGREEVDDLSDSPKSNEFDRAALVKDEDHYIDPDSQSEDMFELMIEDNIQKGLPAQSEQVGVLVPEENDQSESQDPLKLSHQLDSETGHTEENKTEDAESKPRKEPQKRTPASKDKNLANTKKKPVAPIVKKTHASLSRVSKPAPASPAVSMSTISSTKKETSSPLLKKGSPLAVKKRTASPNPMHKLPSLEPTRSDCAAPATARRSFIMENMGDKDIVKRAFRAFQNNFSSSKPSIVDKSPIHQQVPTKITRLTSTSVAPQKNKERVKKAVESTSYQRKQVGARANSVVASSPVKGVGKTSAKCSPSSFGLKSDEREEKHKEPSKKLDKSNAKEVVSSRVLSQAKKKDAESKRLSQSLNSKGTLMPDVQRIAKTRGNKVGASHEFHHQPDSLG